ncbi:MAG: aminopeptidase N, partial [Actinomycetota bacterium]|nr:aminopeptidase N [Actinomycetota bacterium]
MSENNLRREEAAGRARILQVESYDVDLDLTDDSGEKPGETTFRSRTTVRFGCTEPGASTHVDLTAVALISATLNGEALTDFDGNRLQLTSLAAANELVVEADCCYMRTGEGLHRFVDPVDGSVYLYSQFETFEAHRVFACFDQPDLKAVFRLSVRAPRGWVVVSNGEAQERPEGDDPGTWRFTETPRMSTYITALVAGP